MSIEEALPRYLEFLRVEVELSDEEVLDVAFDIRKFRKWRSTECVRLMGDDSIDCFTPADIDRFAWERSEAEADAVEGFVDWLVATEQIQPMERVA